MHSGNGNCRFATEKPRRKTNPNLSSRISRNCWSDFTGLLVGFAPFARNWRVWDSKKQRDLRELIVKSLIKPSRVIHNVVVYLAPSLTDSFHLWRHTRIYVNVSSIDLYKRQSTIVDPIYLLWVFSSWNQLLYHLSIISFACLYVKHIKLVAIQSFLFFYQLILKEFSFWVKSSEKWGNVSVSQRHRRCRHHQRHPPAVCYGKNKIGYMINKKRVTLKQKENHFTSDYI